MQARRVLNMVAVEPDVLAIERVRAHVTEKIMALVEELRDEGPIPHSCAEVRDSVLLLAEDAGVELLRADRRAVPRDGRLAEVIRSCLLQCYDDEDAARL